MTARTHYDNLHISPDASEAEIRQAYRRLSKQYHPDLNQDPDAHRIMQLINQAYEVLSNPQSRAEHDAWIAAQQKTSVQVQIIVPPIQTHNHTTPPRPTPAKRSSTITIIIATLLAIGLLGWQIAELFQAKHTPQQTTHSTSENISTTTHGTLSSVPNTIETPNNMTASSSYIRPYAAPNGNPWPQESGYLLGYPIHYGKGHHRLHIDNVRNSSDVYAELTRDGEAQPLRHFFINERSHLILDKLDAGAYTIRYRQLDAGEELLSERIQIDGKEQETTIYLQRGQAPLN